MRVLIDGLPLLGEASIATYLRELLVHLAREGGEHQYELFFRGFRSDTRAKVAALGRDSELGAFGSKVTVVPDRVLEWCWTKQAVHIPFTEAWLGYPDVFLSTIYLTPVLRGPATVMIAYDLIPLRFPQFYERDWVELESRIRRGIERADAIISISECTKWDFVNLMGADPDRVHVVYPGVDARFTSPADPDVAAQVRHRYGVTRPYVLYVGSLGPHKNVEALVRVFRRLKRAHDLPHQLVLCGRARWGRQVVDAAADLVASGDCVVLDFIPAAEVPCFYRGAEVFAFLSLYEGFGLPPLEAMACGVPVVSSNAGSLPEVIGEAGVLVPPTDEERIEAALLEVLTRPDLRQDLIARGHRQAARFNWSETARQTLKVFAEARGVR